MYEGLVKDLLDAAEVDKGTSMSGLLERAAEAIERLEERVAIGGWISVKDRLPEKAGTYLICDCYGRVISRHFCKSHGKFAGYWHFNGSAYYGNPLYWMPMPESPKDGDT